MGDLPFFYTSAVDELVTASIDLALIYRCSPYIFLERPEREVLELYRLTNARKLTQDKAGALMGISQPEVSRLFKGNFREYSIERLMAFLTTFDRDVEIISRPRLKRTKKSERGQIIFKPVAA